MGKVPIAIFFIYLILICHCKMHSKKKQLNNLQMTVIGICVLFYVQNWKFDYKIHAAIIQVIIVYYNFEQKKNDYRMRVPLEWNE